MPEPSDTVSSDRRGAPTPRSGKARISYAILGAAIAAAVLIGAALLVFRSSSAPGDAGEGTPSASPAGDCAPVVASEIGLDGQVLQPSSPFCLVVADRIELTVGAAALEEGQGLSLSLETPDGAVLATADSSLGGDPVVTVVVDPGAYVGHVSAPDGAEPPPFLVYTSTLAASADAPLTRAVEIPTLADCGIDVAAFTGHGTVETDGDSPFLCLTLTEPTFLVAGAESHAEMTPDQGGPDLTLAVAQFDADGVAQVLRTNDDVFGYDPEVTIDLEPGTYLVQASSWFGTALGDLTLYAGPADSIQRTGAVSAAIADLTPRVCDSAVPVGVGEAITVSDGQRYVCLDNPSQQRLRLEAATLADQDLSLEVVTFVDGAPVRVAWSDDDPEEMALNATDPAIDRVLPEGPLLIVVSTFFDDVIADYDLRVVAAG